MHNVVVLGAGRSGTSAVAGTLATAGYQLGGGEPWPGDHSNPKGYFETREVNGINEDLIAQLLPDTSPLRWGQRWVAHVEPPYRFDVSEEMRQAMRGAMREPFCLKDPRFSYTLAAWGSILPQDVRFVVPVRHPSQVVASIRKSKLASLKGLRLAADDLYAMWTRMHRNVLSWYYHDRRPWLLVSFDRLSEPQIWDQIEAFTGAKVDRSFPEAQLQHTRRTRRPLPEDVAFIWEELLEIIDL